MRKSDDRPEARAAGVFLICHACGTRMHAADRFCKRCGRALLADGASAEPGPAPAPARVPGSPVMRFRRALRTFAARVSVRHAVALCALGALALSLVTLSGEPGKARAEMAGIRIGDPIAKVQRALGTPARAPVPLAWKPRHDVRMWQYDLDPHAGNVPNLSVTFVDGRVWRVASLDKRYATRDGLRVGDSLAKARKLYGTGIEDDADSGLVPWKFICDGQVIKVIVSDESQELLAVGLETPLNFKLVAPPSWHVPGTSEPMMPRDLSRDGGKVLPSRYSGRTGQ